MATRNRWFFILISTILSATGCVSSQRLPGGQVSSDAAPSPDGYRGSFVASPPQVPTGETSPSLSPQGQKPISGVVKNASGRVATSFQKMRGALAIQPQVEASADPLSLSSKTRPLGPDMYLAAARMFEGKGDLARAQAQLEKALQLDPKNRNTLIHFARMKHRTGALEEANQLYRRIIQAFPEDPVAHNDLGLCLARQGRHEESLATLREAIVRRPDSKLYRNNIATVLLEMGRGDEALRQLTQVFPPAEAYHNLGQLFRRRGDLVSAERCVAAVRQQNRATQEQIATDLSGADRDVKLVTSTVPIGQPTVTEPTRR